MKKKHTCTVCLVEHWKLLLLIIDSQAIFNKTGCDFYPEVNHLVGFHSN